MFDTGPNLFQPDNDSAKHESSYRFHYGVPQAHMACFSVLLDRSVKHNLVVEWSETQMSREEETVSFEERIGNTLTAQRFGLSRAERKTALEFGKKKETEWDKKKKTF